MIKILIAMMAAVAITIVVALGYGEYKVGHANCHETGNSTTMYMMVGKMLLPITSPEVICE